MLRCVITKSLVRLEVEHKFFWNIPLSIVSPIYANFISTLFETLFQTLLQTLLRRIKVSLKFDEHIEKVHELWTFRQRK